MASMGRSWGNLANTLRKSRLNTVDELPQKVSQSTQTQTKPVYNRYFHHLFPIANQQRFTQLFLHESSLLRSMFSPLSTQPITITTKENKLER
jgi:hypothetical protein